MLQLSASDIPTPIQIPQNPSVSPLPTSFQRNEGTCLDTEPDQTPLAPPWTEPPPTRASGRPSSCAVFLYSYTIAFLITDKFPHFSNEFTTGRGRWRLIDFFNPPGEKRRPVVGRKKKGWKMDGSPIHCILKLAS